MGICLHTNMYMYTWELLCKIIQLTTHYIHVVYLSASFLFPCKLDDITGLTFLVLDITVHHCAD